MTRADLFVSIVAPLSNDASIVEPFLEEVSSVLTSHYANYEIVLVDDASDDDTVGRVEALLSRFDCIRLIRLSRRFGLEVAVTAGLESSIGDYVVVMVPDTDPPELIPEIVESCRRGVGIVTGIARNGRERSAAAEALARAFHWYARRFWHTDLQPGATHFRVLSRQAVNAITQIRDAYRQLRWFTVTIGFKLYSFPYTPLHRSGRSYKRSFSADASEAIEMMIVNSRHPLRFASQLGLLASVANLVYLGYVVAIYLFKSNVAAGWTTLSLQQGVMFFLLFVVLTVLSEYTGRILEETRHRPLYFIMDEKNSSVLLQDYERRNVVNESA
jgi:glycosyltransferase involved in cell wall biosynthesis